MSLRQTRCVDSNSLVANILIVSENFYGFKTGSSSSSCNNDSLSSCRSKSSSHHKSKYFKSNSNDSLFKNSFKIYLLNTTCQTLGFQLTPVSASTSMAAATTASTTSTDLDDQKSRSNDFERHDTKSTDADAKLRGINTSSSKSNTLNQGFMRRIYETTMKLSMDPVVASSSSISTPITNNNNNMALAIKNQLTITNDMYSSFAYNEKLQFKLERYFENICLKSSTFSNTNFSYVDYSSKR